MNQLCKVCGEPAAGYHFGAFTCEGCKSFFGRTYNNLSALGECKNSGQCVINKKNRTSCKSCRLKKCLMVGMSKSGSRYGRRSNWFKIHCLIQDQAEMNKLAEHGVVGNGHHFHHYFNNNNNDCHKDSNSSATASPTGTSSPNDPMKRFSPFEQKLHHHQHHHSMTPSGNHGQPPPRVDSSSPPFDRKDTIVFHPLPLSPVSPMSPLHSKFFFHHPNGSGNASLLYKGFNGLTKMFHGAGGGVNGSGGGGAAVGADFYPFPSRYLPVVPFVKPRLDASPVALDTYADLPEQVKPMDLTIRKSDDLDSSDILLDVETFVKREESSGDEEDGLGEPMEGTVLRETPLDLTKRLSRED